MTTPVLPSTLAQVCPILKRFALSQEAGVAKAEAVLSWLEQALPFAVEQPEPAAYMAAVCLVVADNASEDGLAAVLVPPFLEIASVYARCYVDDLATRNLTTPDDLDDL